MDSISIITTNLLSPPVIAFGAGLTAHISRSDFKFPTQLYEALSIYLLLAIGFKGGASLLSTPASQLILPIAAVAIAGISIPIVAYWICRKLLRFSVDDAAAMAAHYGSVSAVTFMACISFLEFRQIAYESYLPALMALMEIPAIAVALILFRLAKSDHKSTSLSAVAHEVFAGKSIFLLVTGLIAGALAGPSGFERAKPFLVEPFYGVLILFLLEMGINAGKQITGLKGYGTKLVLFGIVMPLLQAMLGLLLARMAGLSVGGTTAFMVLSASASYIAAPAVVRIAIPEANPGRYVTASLGITFPFNLAVGIPLYYVIASLTAG